jgi:hypothetical protein
MAEFVSFTWMEEGSATGQAVSRANKAGYIAGAPEKPVLGSA